MRLSRLTGVRAAGRKLARELYWATLDFRGRAAGRTVTGADLKLNLGCGADIRPGWVNIDLTPQADVKVDLREPWPVEDGSAALAHAEHFFEHLEHLDGPIASRRPRRPSQRASTRPTRLLTRASRPGARWDDHGGRPARRSAARLARAS